MDAESAERPGCGHAARELLSFYLNGSLEDDEREEVQAHVQVCPACAREVEEFSGIAAALEAYGAGSRQDQAPSRRWRTTGALGLAAALLIAASLAVLWTRPWWKGIEPEGSGVSGEVHLDLGAGLSRNEDRAPEVVLEASTLRVVMTFFPPARPGARYRVCVVDGEGRQVVPEESLGRLDEIGRALLRVNASALERDGPYQVLLRTESPSGEVDAYPYPFEVRRSGDDQESRP